MGTFECLHLHDFSSRELKLFLFFVDEGNVIIWLCVSKFSFIGYIRIFAKKSYDFFVRVLPGGDFDYFLFSSRTLEKWSNLTSIFFEWVETINLSIATPWKINGWNLQITHEKKGTWSSKPLQYDYLWLCSMLIFQGVSWGSRFFTTITSCHPFWGQGDKGTAGGTGFLHYSADGQIVWISRGNPSNWVMAVTDRNKETQQNRVLNMWCLLFIHSFMYLFIYLFIYLLCCWIELVYFWNLWLDILWCVYIHRLLNS